MRSCRQARWAAVRHTWDSHETLQTSKTRRQFSQNSTIATQWLPFSIQSEKLTIVNLKLATGQSQAIRIRFPPEADGIRRVRLTIKGQQLVVSDGWWGRSLGKPLRVTLALAPNRYKVTATTREGYRASAELDVKDREGPTSLELSMRR